ncbi:MAG: GDSL-type esterase/lipase family protein [Bacteroidales bacterium]|jgi:lysophospholipase L1-like esterase
MNTSYIKFILLSSLLFFSVTLCAQYREKGNSVVWKIGFNEQFEDNLNFKERYSDEIKAIAQKSKRGSGISKDIDVLFVGSSSIRGWRSVYQDMQPLNVVNNGFGGSTIRDILYHYKVLVKPFNPDKIVLYVENDIIQDAAVETYILFDLFRIFAHKVNSDFPLATLYIVSIKPSPSRFSLIDKQIAINKMLKSFADKMPNIEYIDVASQMMTPNGVDSTLFINDKLHMNAKGYQLWTTIIRPLLIK